MRTSLMALILATSPLALRADPDLARFFEPLRYQNACLTPDGQGVLYTEHIKRTVSVLQVDFKDPSNPRRVLLHNSTNPALSSHYYSPPALWAAMQVGKSTSPDSDTSSSYWGHIEQAKSWSEHFPGRTVTIQNTNASGTLSILLVQGPADPGRYFLAKAGPPEIITELLPRHPALPANALNPANTLTVDIGNRPPVEIVLIHPRQAVDTSATGLVLLCKDSLETFPDTDFPRLGQALAELGHEVALLRLPYSRDWPAILKALHVQLVRMHPSLAGNAVVLGIDGGAWPILACLQDKTWPSIPLLLCVRRDMRERHRALTLQRPWLKLLEYELIAEADSAAKARLVMRIHKAITETIATGNPPRENEVPKP